MTSWFMAEVCTSINNHKLFILASIDASVRLGQEPVRCCHQVVILWKTLNSYCGQRTSYSSFQTHGSQQQSPAPTSTHTCSYKLTAQHHLPVHKQHVSAGRGVICSLSLSPLTLKTYVSRSLALSLTVGRKASEGFRTLKAVWMLPKCEEMEKKIHNIAQLMQMHKLQDFLK